MKRIITLFPGGGVQYVGMSKLFYQQYPQTRDVFDQAEDLLNLPLKKKCFEGDFASLSEMDISQPAIFTAGVAAQKVFESLYDFEIVASAGHSLGEYAALHCAGAIPFSTALSWVKMRGKLLRQAGSNGETMMAVYKLDGASVEEECRHLREEQNRQVYVASYNSPKQQVISGPFNDIIVLKKQLEKRGAETNILNISTPSHCPLMKNAAQEFRQWIGKFQFREFNWPVISNVTAAPHHNTPVAEFLHDHIVKPVQWEKTMNYIASLHPDAIIDMGPQSVLKKLAVHNQMKTPSFSFDTEEDRSYLDSILTRLKSPKQVIHKCLMIVASTKNYATEPELPAYVLAAYYRLRQMAEGSDNFNSGEAIQLTKHILSAKQTPREEQDSLLQGL